MKLIVHGVNILDVNVLECSWAHCCWLTLIVLVSHRMIRLLIVIDIMF